MKEAKNCVLCFKTCSDIVEEAGDLEGDGHKKTTLSKQLRTIFILRNLLKVESASCEAFLVNWGNPSSWITTCSRCSLTVDEAFFIHTQVITLQKKLSAIGKRIRVDLRNNRKASRLGNRELTRRKRLDPVTFDIQAEVARLGEWESEETSDNKTDFKIKPSSSKSKGSSFVSTCGLKTTAAPGEEYDETLDLLTFDFETAEDNHDSIELSFLKEEPASDSEQPDQFMLESCDEVRVSEPNRAVDNFSGRPLRSCTTARKRAQTGEKGDSPNKCDLCFKSYANSNKLRNHRRTVHFITAQEDANRRLSLKTAHKIIRGKRQSNLEVEDLILNDTKRSKVEPSVRDVDKMDSGDIEKALILPQENCDDETQSDASVHSSNFDDANGNDSDSDWELEVKGSKKRVYSKKEKEDRKTCVLCHKTFETYEEVLAHGRREHGLGVRHNKNKASTLSRCTCTVCDRTFSSYVNLRNHRRRVHNMRVYFPQSKDVIKQKQLWNCLKCGVGFAVDIQRDEHEKAVHNLERTDLSFQCVKCPKAYSINEELILHFNNTHKRQQIRCGECKMKFSSYKELNNHFRVIHEKRERLYPCDLCDYTSLRLCTLEVHSLAIHGVKYEKYKFKCVSCPRKKFINSKQFKNHIKLMHEDKPEPNKERPYKCSICNYASIRYAALKNHCLCIHGQDISKKNVNEAAEGSGPADAVKDKFHEKAFKCSVCKYESLWHRSFQRHSLAVHGLTVPDLPKRIPKKACEHCFQKFSSLKLLQEHLSTQHTQEKSRLKCPICGYVSQSRQYLSIHMNIHTGERPYVCETCGKSFKTLAYFNFHQTKEHMKLREDERNPLECHHCKRKFSTSTYLKKHVRHVHDKKYRFTCEVCGLGCPEMCTLRKHMLSHSDVRNFKCSIENCNQAFKSESAVLKHIKIKHDKVKTHSCPQCPKAFYGSKDLRRHEEAVHSGIRPYKCKICDKGFSTSDYLHIHGRSHQPKSERSKPRKYCRKRIRNGNVTIKRVDVTGHKHENEAISTRNNSSTSQNNSVARLSSTAGVLGIENPTCESLPFGDQFTSELQAPHRPILALVSHSESTSAISTDHFIL